MHNMKRILPLLIAGLFIATTLEAQQKTAFGDEVGTLDGIMKAYYDVVTIKKGEKVSYQRDSCLHVPNAVVGFARPGKEGKTNLKWVSLKQFHIDSDAVLEKDGFCEKELARKVESYGAIYHVWSTYESRNSAEGPVLERGINSIQLFFDGTRYWILSWTVNDETKELPIPRKYLKQ